MIRPVLTEIGIFLIPFAVYALFLVATRSGVLAQSSWPAHLVAKLVLGSLLLVIVSFIMLAHFSGAPPDSTYIPAHIENGKFVPGVETGSREMSEVRRLATRPGSGPARPRACSPCSTAMARRRAWSAAPSATRC